MILKQQKPPHFNPRPREEGDSMLCPYFILLVISIHALVKRATDSAAISGGISLISIHALVKRATNSFEFPNIYQIDFNPRPREEGDLVHCLYYTVSLYFNPRPREEGDQA